MSLDPAPLTPIWRVAEPPAPDRAISGRARLALAAVALGVPVAGKLLLLALLRWAMPALDRYDWAAVALYVLLAFVGVWVMFLCAAAALAGEAPGWWPDRTRAAGPGDDAPPSVPA